MEPEMNHIKKPQLEKEELGLVRTVIVFGVPMIVIIEILLASKVFG